MALRSVKSADRAIDLLDLFRQCREPLSLKAICNDLGYPQSSATVLLKTLMAKGYLNYDRHRRVYFPTMKVAALGDWIAQSLFGRGDVLRAMRDLHSETGETVVIAARNDIFIQYIQKLDTKYEFRHHIEEGTMKYITHSAVGWELMTDLSPAEIENIVRRANIAAGKDAAVDVEHTIRMVRQTRRQGYGYVENTPYLGAATVCVRLPITVNDQPVVLACGGVVERIRQNKLAYLDALKRCAASLMPDEGSVPG